MIFEDNLPKFERLFALADTADENFIRQAAEIGVTDMAGEPSEELIANCRKYKMDFYPVVTINPGIWEKTFPGREIPLQKMTPEQEALKAYLDGSKVPELKKEFLHSPDQPENWQVSERQKRQIEALRKSNFKLQKAYQWGGEPQKKHITRSFNDEVLIYDLLCFHHPQVMEALKQEIKEYLSLPGVAGIAFDGIGYQNYHDCKCPESMRLYQEYCKAGNIKPSEKAWNQFSLDSLVDFNNKLADYVHELNPDAKAINRIWPVYLPEPLYGNRLKMDYCGQTAAWYFYWNHPRIEQCSRTIATDQKKYWPNAQGVAFIGYRDHMEHDMQFPYKSPEMVERELRAILKGGSRMLMCGGLADVVNNPKIAGVFKKFMKKNE